MQRNKISIIALDKDCQVISPLRYTNLQWNRKYYECGTFSIEIPVKQFSSDIVYLYSKDRPEMGKVSQINYMDKGRYKRVQLSGYFIEKEVDKHIAYPNGSTNITNAPTWVEQSGNAEDVAYAFFEAFRLVETANRSCDLGIVAATSQGRGKTAVHTRNGEMLGAKIYSILKPSEMSCRVEYDFENNVKTFSVWMGLDRTDTNEELNNPVIFSTKYGNIEKPDILISKTKHKNACIVTNGLTSNEASEVVTRAVFAESEDEEIDFLYLTSMLQKAEYTEATFPVALESEAVNKIAEYPVTVNVEFNALEGSYEYMTDFDLGDKCSVEIPEVDLSLQIRLIGCYEVIKSNKWTMTMEFGTPIIIRK